MPRVPLYQPGNIMPQGTTDARVRPANFNGGEIIGRAVERFGQNLSEYADNQAQIDEMQARAAAKDAESEVRQHFVEAGYTGPNAYFSKQGKDALELRPNVEKSLDTLIQRKAAELKTPYQKKLFTDAITPQRQSWGIQIAQHAATEVRAYDIDESASRVTLSGELARSTYIADPEHGEAQIATGLDEIDNLAKLQGWGSEKKALERLKFTSGAYKDVGTAVASMDPANGPALAQAFVVKHGDSMTGDDRQAVLNRALTEQHAYEAEQRRQEAETRRLEREAKQDAKDRAESAARAIDDGTVLTPERMTSAMSDAQLAGDDSLVERIRQGGLKNGLTQQYANATPAELQQRVNELSAEITKKGGKVNPDLVVERDHLQTLVGKSRTALRTDPLAWGAEHLGITTGPLNLSDPASVSARVNAATTIAARTGTIPKPLTQDEVAASQQVLQNGDVNAKVGLYMRLSKLGPLALPAAEQLSNNPAVLNLVGLATHSNRGVAMARVNQIVTGYEVLKTKPKLIDKDQATVSFNGAVGTALQFLPQVRDGAFSNAAALLAAESNEKGWSDWSQAQGDWLPAINSALGGHGNGADRRGGLWKLNGAVTVLPDNMTGAEFEEAVSRSNAPELKRAHNGTPVFADGRTPSSTEIKRMQWIPSGDGIYRISDGNGFLRTKNGAFYEIDVSKLRFDSQLAAHGYVRR